MPCAHRCVCVRVCVCVVCVCVCVCVLCVCACVRACLHAQGAPGGDEGARVWGSMEGYRPVTALGGLLRVEQRRSQQV